MVPGQGRSAASYLEVSTVEAEKHTIMKGVLVFGLGILGRLRIYVQMST